jgi:hypothetical protein
MKKENYNDKNPIQEEYFCSVCSRTYLPLKIFPSNNSTVDKFTKTTCPECLKVRKQNVEKLPDELNRNSYIREILAEQSQKIRTNNKEYFVSKYGLGVKKKCDLCNHEDSYLCIVVGESEGHKESFYEISGSFCSDCITNNKMLTHVGNEYSELLLFFEQMENTIKKVEFFGSIKGTSLFTEDEQKNLISTLKHAKELDVHADKINRKGDAFGESLFAYKGIPVIVSLRITAVGDGFSIVWGSINGINDTAE